METDQEVLAVADENEREEETSSCKEQNITQVEQQPLLDDSEIFVDKVMASTPFQYNHMDNSIVNLCVHATELKAQSSNSTNTTSTTAEISNKADAFKKIPLIREISRVELQSMERCCSVLRKDPFKKKKQVLLGTAKEASKGFNCNMQQSEKLMANVDHVTESSNTTISTNTKVKKSLIGIRRQKNGRYGAVIGDPIRHKQVWLGTFDTVEEASKAYFSKKSVFDDEKLSLQGNNKENKPKKNCDQIQHESLVVVSSSVPNDQTLNTASMCRTTQFLNVYKKKSGKYTTEIRHPISEKRIWLGTFATAEEASQAYQSKKLEFQKLVEEQQQCNDKPTHDSKQDGKENLVNVDKQGNENVNCEWFQPESAGGSETEQGILVEVKEVEETSSKKQKITQVINSDDSHAAAHEGQERRSSSVEQQHPEHDVLEIFVDKVKSSTPFQHNQMESSIAISGLPATKLKAQNSNSSNSTSTAAESSKKADGKMPFIREISQVELMSNVHVTEQSNTRSTNPKVKRSLIGIQRQKNGRYGAVIRDPIRHKQVWLGTFDTVEEASEAIISKKSEFENISLQGNKENRPKKNSHHIRPELPNVASSSVPNNQTLNTASVGIGSPKTTHITRVGKSKMTGKHMSDITNPITKKKIWLGTFGTAEEASQAYQSKKLEFQKLLSEKQQQCNNKKTHGSKQDGKEKSVAVEQGHEYTKCEQLFQPESAGVSDIDIPVSNSSNGGTDQRIDSHEIGTPEEAFQAYQFKKFDFQSSKNVELQSDMPNDPKQQGQMDEDLSMGQWVQLPGDREVKFSEELGLPIVDNYGSLLGEFSSLDDDLSIC